MPPPIRTLQYLFKPRSGLELAAELAARGRQNELYFTPKVWSLEDRKKAAPAIRDLITDGIVSPAYFKQDGKSASAVRLANTMMDDMLPKRGYNQPWHDDLVIMPSRSGREADAAAMLDSPETLRNEDFMYLQDIAANPEAKGTGESLLRAILDGDLHPSASRVAFTPLEGAKDFYRKKFGMRWLSPREAAEDPVIDAILGGAGQRHNAEDLGVGIINRKSGGLVALRR